MADQVGKQMSKETLKEKTTRGLFWGGMNNVVQQGLASAPPAVAGKRIGSSSLKNYSVYWLFACKGNYIINNIQA
jgi:hypothetical protein